MLSISCHLLYLGHATGHKCEEGNLLPGEDDPGILCWRNHGNDPGMALRGRADRFEGSSHGIAAYLQAYRSAVSITLLQSAKNVHPVGV